MPIIKFQCHSCGLSFSKRVDTNMDTHICTCKANAISVNAKASIGYGQISVEEVKPQSTGVEGLDTDFARVMMQDSKQKWEIARQRNKEKWEILQNNPEITPYDIVVGYNDEYIADKKYHTTQKEIKNEARKELGCDFQQK